MVTIRELNKEDIPAIARLRQKAFARSHHETVEALEAHLEGIFFADEWPFERLPSLVLTGSEGEVAGFLGLLPRELVYDGEPVLAGLVTQLMVAKQYRGLGGVRLLRHAFNAPADLLFSDAANNPARALWEGLGGRTSIPHSLIWTRPLRPWRHAADRIGGRRPLVRAFRVGARPVLRFLDSMVQGDDHATFALPERPPGTLEPLGLSGLYRTADAWAKAPTLRPDHSAPQLEWIETRLASAPWIRETVTMGVVGGSGEVEGGFVAYVSREGEVLQVLYLNAKKGAAGRTLDHLLHYARDRGFHAVSGRFDPRYAAELGGRAATIHREGPWVVLQSRRRELLDAMEQGDTLFSMLEGERYLSF